MFNNNHHLAGSTPKPHPPIENAACLSLVERALKDAREKTLELVAGNAASPAAAAQAQKSGLSINLCHSRIATIPLEVIELIRDEIERLVVEASPSTCVHACCNFSNCSLPQIQHGASGPNGRCPYNKHPISCFMTPISDGCRAPRSYRLALAHNQLSSFPEEFAGLCRLRYLNLRSNRLKVFPALVRYTRSPRPRCLSWRC